MTVRNARFARGVFADDDPHQVTPQLFGYPEYQPRQPMTDPTRHLCTAAYLDGDFADAVIAAEGTALADAVTRAIDLASRYWPF